MKYIEYARIKHIIKIRPGPHYYTHSVAVQVAAKRKKQHETKGGKVYMATYESVLAKANEIRGVLEQAADDYEEEPLPRRRRRPIRDGEQASHSAEENVPLQDGEVDSQPVESGEDDDADGYMPSREPKAKARKVVADPTDKLRQAAGEMPAAAAPKANRKRARAGSGGRGRGRGRGGKDEPSDGQDDEDEDAAPDIELLQETDEEIYEIAKAHADIVGKSSSCWRNLAVARFLEGEKLGQSITGAALLVSLCNAFYVVACSFSPYPYVF